VIDLDRHQVGVVARLQTDDERAVRMAEVEEVTGAADPEVPLPRTRDRIGQADAPERPRRGWIFEADPRVLDRVQRDLELAFERERLVQPAVPDADRVFVQCDRSAYDDSSRCLSVSRSFTN
jgi:hypothetical protein